MDKKNNQLNFNDSEELLWKVMNSIPLRIFWKDSNLNYLGCNENFLKDSGYESYTQLVGKSDYDMNWKEFADLYREDDQNVLDTGKSKLNYEEKVVDNQGNTKWVKTTKLPLYGADGKVKGVLGIFEDITQRKIDETNTENIKNMYEELAKKSKSIAFEVDKYGKYTYINDVVFDVLGYKPDEIIGKKYFYDLACDNEKENLEKFGKLVLDNQESLSDYEHKLCHKSKKSIWVLTNGAPLYDLDGNYIGFRGVDIDINKIKESEERILYLSYHDQLTGLYNRRFFEEELLRLDTSRNYPISVLMIDVNGLKLMNDAFGHEAGDELIVTLAKSMKYIFRSDDIISRVGGDEFVILLPSTNESDVKKLSKRLMEDLSSKKVRCLDVSVSFGYCTKYDNSISTEDIIKRAEADMYKYKTVNRTRMRNSAIEAIINQLFEKVKDEKLHANLVSKFCRNIAKAMNFDEDDLNEIEKIGLLHDVGKIAIPDGILDKKDSLTDQEWADIKKHPETSYIILSSSSDYINLSEAVLYHHERYDGTGYPKGLIGNEIPLYSRIIAVADTYASLISKRPYRKAITRDKAIEILEKESSTKFDPEIVKLFINSKCYL
jgi:diguanylate cyclase (GGDEF)-like protein/PAS domain S-box-containing protein